MRNVFTMDGVPGQTWTQTSADIAEALTAANLLSGTNRAIAVLITCEDNDVKFCLGGSTPVSDGLGHVLADGQSIMLANASSMKNFSFISSSAGSAGVLQITAFFEPGR